MNIILYSSSAENSRINKLSYLTQQRVLSGTLREATSIITPSVVVQSNGLPQGNYAYIEDFNRYYFITNITSVNLNLWRIDMRCDVLMSHKDEFLNLSAYVSRYQYSEETEFIDKVRPVKSVPTISALFTITLDNLTFYVDDSGLGSYPYYVLILDGTRPLVHSTRVKSVNTISDNEGNSWNLNYSYEADSGSMTAYRVYFFYTGNSYSRNLLIDILTDLTNDTALLSHLIGLYLVPNIKDFTRLSYPVDTIIIGDRTYTNNTPSGEVSYVRILYPDGNNWGVFDYDISQTIANIYDMEPYSLYSLYIPFFGNINIDGKYFKNGKVLIRLSFDFTTLKMYFSIYSCVIDEDPIIISSGDMMWGYEISVSSTGSIDQQRQTSYNQMVKEIADTKAGYKFATDFISGVSGIAGGIVNENPGGAIVGVGNTINSFVTMGGNFQTASMMYEANEVLNVQIGSINKITSSGVAVYMSTNKMILYKSYVEPAIDDEDFARLCGLPYNKYVQLNGLNGFAIVSDIHLENLPSCLEDEKTELHTLLRQGCIYESTAS